MCTILAICIWMALKMSLWVWSWLCDSISCWLVQSNGLFKTAEYVLLVQDDIKWFSVFVPKTHVNNNQAGSNVGPDNFMIFHQSLNRSKLVNFNPSNGVVICDFMSTCIVNYLHTVYTNDFQVSWVTFSATSPIHHCKNIIMICPTKLYFPYT